jgi:hypothetical protein
MSTAPLNVIEVDVPSVPKQQGVIPQRQEVHPSKNIQLGVELWERAREYDARAAAEAAAGLLPVLTRNQKQKIKMQNVLTKQPTQSRTRGDTQPPAQ